MGNVASAARLVDALVVAGVRHAVLCPGSRSSPLALALAEHPGLRLWMHLDERAAAFFALGLARQTAAPVAVACSSGTAAANFLPAVVEAQLSRVPLVVLTADRPPELREVGAPQTIDQLRLYGSHVKWFADLPVPDGTGGLARQAAAAGAHAVGLARLAPAGPVHLNVPFREPLLDEPGPPQPGAAAPAAVPGRRALEAAAAAELAAELAARPRGIIVCGPQDDPAFPAAVAALAAQTGFPVFADPLSGVRHGAHDRSAVVDRYDAFLRAPAVARRFTPDVVLRFGALPTSKPLWERLADAADGPQILVDDGGWRDPLHAASQVIAADPVALCAALAAVLTPPAQALAWREQWLALDGRTHAELSAALAEDEAIFEGRVFAELVEQLAPGTTLVAGNSMPVRDLDTFGRGRAAALRCVANRGANGIDGVVSSALGAAATGDRVALALGDLSFFHDSSGLLAAKLHRLDATIVVLNNDGGGIFSFLPQVDAVSPARFEQLFGTPTGLEPERIAAVYDAAYARASSWDDLRGALADASARGLRIVELRTRRDDNVRRHRAIAARVVAALQNERAIAR